MSRQATPDVQRLRLRLSLRKARDRADFSKQQVADELGWSLSKITRIESGQLSPSKTDIMGLLSLYGVDDPEYLDQLAQYSREGRRQSWHAYRDILKPEVVQFLGYEEAASKVFHFEPVLIPGLLQTEAYATALARMFATSAADSNIERLVQIKKERQKLLDDPDVSLKFVIDEAVVRRWAGDFPGDSLIMQGQLEWLKQLARKPNITIQVLPFTYGFHAGMQGPFILMELAEVNETVLYLESAKGSSITKNNETTVLRYGRIFRSLADAASDRNELDSALDPILAAMRAGSRG